MKFILFLCVIVLGASNLYTLRLLSDYPDKLNRLYVTSVSRAHNMGCNQALELDSTLNPEDRRSRCNELTKPFQEQIETIFR